MERNTLHPAAIRPFQAITEEVPLDFAFFTAQVRRRHPLNPKRQRVTTQLLGERRVKHRFVVERPASRFLLRLLPDFLDEPVDVLLDSTGIEYCLGVQLLEERPTFGGI